MIFFLLGLFFLAQLLFVRHTLNGIKDAVIEAKEFESINKGIKKKWHKIPGVITRLGYNVDHPGTYPDVEKLTSDERSLKLKEYAERINECRELMILDKGVMIEYRYEIENKIYYSRDISMIPSTSDLDFMYKLSVGMRIPVWVNPRDHENSFLRSVNKKEFSLYVNSLVLQKIPVIVVSVFVSCITISWIASEYL